MKNAVVVKFGGYTKGIFNGLGIGRGKVVCQGRCNTTDEFGYGFGNGFNLSRTENTELFKARNQAIHVTPLLSKVPKFVLQFLEFMRRTEVVFHKLFEIVPRHSMCDLVSSFVVFSRPPLECLFTKHPSCIQGS
ncbi:hypothetical protein HanRHA438_Chr05g0231611 [Helianthus annuus]|nr:hypothetical protein HanIR_Chr05g0239481 [Helianthus annuus]KAJ0919609.1 hypothetical protein HanRHA438_Chr05g0231611 [Helianthus annuus]